MCHILGAILDDGSGPWILSQHVSNLGKPALAGQDLEDDEITDLLLSFARGIKPKKANPTQQSDTVTTSCGTLEFDRVARDVVSRATLSISSKSWLASVCK